MRHVKLFSWHSSDVRLCCSRCLYVRLIFMGLSGFGFFFFKQKTAYEMRISDWSSDVCSSDLVVILLIALPIVTLVVTKIQNDAAFCAKAEQRRTETKQKIGRASCRERVCQHV